MRSNRKNTGKLAGIVLGASAIVGLEGCGPLISAYGVHKGNPTFVKFGDGITALEAAEKSRSEVNVNVDGSSNQNNSRRFYEGKMINGAFYRGELFNNKPHGWGVYTIPNGDSYRGDFRNGFFEGNGIYTRANGDIYHGDFHNGLREGNGIFKSPDGIIARGMWKDDEMYGKFNVTDDRGSNYTIEFVNGEVINAEGTSIIPNGKKYMGEWFHRGEGRGKGKIIYPDGREYTGEWKDPNPKDEDVRNFPNGKGTMVWPDGKEYTGEWMLAEMHGFGSLTLEDGTKKEGFFRKGKFVGRLVKEER